MSGWARPDWARTERWADGAARLTGIDPRVVDAGLATVLGLATCVVGAQYHPSGWPRFDWPAYALSLLVSLPLAVRRRAPWVAFLISCAACVAYLAAGYQPSLNWWGPALGLYGVAASRPARQVAAAAMVEFAVQLYNGLSAPLLSLVVALAQAFLIVGIALVFGTNSRRLAERNRRLAAVTAALRQEQLARARRAVDEERLRIARELHDVVAHHMSVVSVQAGLARYVFAADPGTAREAVETIAESTQEALEELRRLVGLLRESPVARTGPSTQAPDVPAPGLGALPDLVERVRAADVPVRVVTIGAPRRLPSGLDLCAFRVIQESLTNIIKHAPGAMTTVRLQYGADQLDVQISNGRPTTEPPGPPVTGQSPGHGLIGMRERAKLYGGTLQAGPEPTGGFTVMLTLPLAQWGEPPRSSTREASEPDAR